MRLAAVLTSLGLVVGVAELIARISAETPWYERLPGEQRPVHLQAFDIGGASFQLRYPPLNLPKLKGTKRILFLGDSFTYGQGVAEGATFVSRVSELLNERLSTNTERDFEVFNGGIPGSLTGDWVDLFDRMAARFHPDWVVAVFFLRDGVAGVTSMQQIDAIRRRMHALREQSVLYRFSRLYRLVHDARVQRELSRQYLGRIAEGYLGPPSTTAEWMRARSNLRHIRDESGRLGAQLVLVIFPVLFELDGHYPLTGVVDEIARFGEEEGLPTLSLLPAFQGRSAPDLWVSSLNQHPNQEAHAIAAEAIYAFLAPRI